MERRGRKDGKGMRDGGRGIGEGKGGRSERVNKGRYFLYWLVVLLILAVASHADSALQGCLSVSGVAVTAFVTSTKLCYIEPGLYWNWLVVTTFGGSTVPVFIQATQAHSAWPSLRG